MKFSLAWIWELFTGNTSARAREWVDDIITPGVLSFFEAMDRINQSKEELGAEETYERLIESIVGSREDRLTVIAVFR